MPLEVKHATLNNGVVPDNAAFPVGPDEWDASHTLTGELPVESGGTGSATAADARTALGVVIGTNVQAWNANLDSWAGVTRASGFDTFAATPSSANLASLVTDETGSGALVFGTSPQISAIELGHSSDTTLSRASAGVVAVEGVPLGVAPTIQVFTAAGTWTKPANCKKIIVFTTGGGGGGGGAQGGAAQSSAGSGGGAGGTAIEIIDVTGVSSEGVTVGAAGTAGTGSSADVGGNGGQSSFGTVAYHTANGGGGGIGQVTGTAIAAAVGNDGGVAANGLINISGGGTQPSVRLTAAIALSTGGGASYWGGGGRGVTGDSLGANGVAYGSGGGGGSTNSATHRNGGAGAAGIVVVYEFY